MAEIQSNLTLKKQEMKTKLTGNELLHILFLKALPCWVHPFGYLIKISEKLDEKWLSYS